MAFLIKINDWLESVLKVSGAVLLFIFTSVVLLQVIARNYLQIAFTWTIEISLMTFIWAVFLGAAVAIRQRKHYIVEVFPSSFVRTNVLLDVLSDILGFVFIYVLIRGGWDFTIMGMQRYCSSIDVSQAWLVAAMPVSAVFMFLFSLEVFIGDLGRMSKAFSGKEAI